MTNCNAKPNTRLFIDMEAKNKHLRIRLTERQVMRLAEVLLDKQKNKSAIVRDALDNYMDETEKSHDPQTQSHIKNKKILK